MLRNLTTPPLRLPRCALCAALLLLASAQSGASPGKEEMVVVIDPGHGGRMSLGAKGATAYEKDITLSIAKKIGALVAKKHPDVEIVYTRTADAFVDLEARGALANKMGADLFVSIHANASTDKATTGTETWVMGVDKAEQNMSVAMTENAEILYEEGYEDKYEGYDPTSPESFIIFSFVQHAYMEQSLHFAALVEKSLAGRAGRKSRGVKQGPFLVLWRTNMPSVLIEIGFLSNREEERHMTSDKGQSEIAEAIVAAISEYKKRWEKGHNPTAPHTTTGADKPAAAKTRATYHVQILSTSRALSATSREFKGLKGVEHYRYGSAYRYYVGTFATEKDANRLLREVKAKFPDAFVVKR